MNPPRIVFVIFAATTAAGAKCTPDGEVTQRCLCTATECEIGQVCTNSKNWFSDELRCKGAATYSSEFINHWDLYPIKTISLETSSSIFRKVFDSKVEDRKTTIAERHIKGLQNYALALDVAEKENKIPLLEDIPVLCTESEDGTGCSEYPRLKVYTDNDDTVKCSGSENASGHHYIFSKVAGVDQACISGSYYVGVAEFFHELSTDGIGENGKLEIEKKKKWEGKVFQVSANPFPKYYKEGTFMRKLLKKNFRGNMYLSIKCAANNRPMATALVGYGGRAALGRNIYFKSWLPVGIVKANDIYHEVETNPKQKNNIVFVGDDGQGDALTAILVAATVRVSFIHRVSSDTSNQAWVGENDYDTVLLKDHVAKMKNIVYFNTYSEAAELAMQLKLISKAAAARVHKASLSSALGKACCEEKACDIESAENKWDNTCGPEANSYIYEEGATTLKWGSKYCAPVRDAWEYYSEKYMAQDGEPVTCSRKTTVTTVTTVTSARV